MIQLRILFGVLYASCLAIPGRLSAQDSVEKEDAQVSFAQHIEPIFRSHCQGCHQPAKAQGGFEMTQFAHLLDAGESGEVAVVPGDAEASYLMEQITSVDGIAAMPKDAAPLSEVEVGLIRQWIRQGAINDGKSLAPKYTPDNPPTYVRPAVITTLAFSPDGKWLAVSGIQEVVLLDAQTLQLEKRLVGLSERVESLSFSPDSKRLAVTGGSPGRLGEVQVWDVESATLHLSHNVSFDTVAGGAFSPDGKLIAFGCSDNTVRAIDAETGEQRLHQGAHDDWIRSCVFTPDGKHVLSAARDMTVKLTEVETERFIDNITSITPGALRGGVNSLAMHPQRNEVLVGGSDGTPKVYRIFRETERRIGDDANLIRQFPAMQGRIFSVAVAPSGAYLAAASTLDGESWLAVYPYNFDASLPDDVKAVMAERVASRTAEQNKLVADYISNVPDALVNLKLDGLSAYAIAFSADGEQLAVGGSDGHVRIVNVASSQIALDTIPFPLTESSQADSHHRGPLAAASGLPPADTALPTQVEDQRSLPETELMSMEVSPTEIHLSNNREYVQLVVTASFAGGQRCDVTRLVDVDAASAPVTVSELGLVRAKATGSGQLKISLRNQLLSIPVNVASAAAPEVTDFVRDVNPLISRLGCNAGTCHGAQKGKNGFKLSLRGYDPLEDVRALSDDLSARRLNTAAPDASLMLLKTLGIVPHEGGLLLTQDSVYYDTLRNWIAEGAQLNANSTKVARIEVFPNKPVIEREKSWQQFRVIAYFPDGSKRDVTHEAFIESGDSEICLSQPDGRVQAIRRGEAPILARYEGAYAAATVTVMGDRSDFAWSEPETNNTIDQLAADKWQRMKIAPSPVCEDHEFLRRVRLDLTGLPPTSDELKAFLDDPRPSKVKRREVIERLLTSDDYVEHWTNKWADLLQVNSKFIGNEGAQAFRDWIRDSISQNKPYDQFAREVLTASGSNKENPPASYFKILRDPDIMMENTTHLFLAVRFNCNKCHDHPFERWTQDQYYELAAFFARTGLKEDPASGGKKLGGTAVEGAKPLYEEVFDKSDGEMTHVRTGKQVAPAFPFECDFESSDGASRRQQLANWITSPDNPYFAKSFVNRLWGYLTGTGLVMPLDDIRAGNPPTNPELLDHLTREFVDTGFDVQHVLRLICNSRVYQLSVATNSWNQDDELNYSHAKARRLPAEVLYDAVYRVTGAVSDIPGVAPGTRAASLPDVAVQLPDGFLNNLGRPVRESACECERSDELQLGPVMALVSGPTVGKAISDPQCALPKMAKGELSEEQMIEEIYLRVLSRQPSPEETAVIVASADQIVGDHRRLEQQLSDRENWWAGERKRREEKRVADLQKTKRQIKDRAAAIADERAAMEQARREKLAAAEQQLDEFAASSVDLAGRYLDELGKQPHWFPLAPKSLASSAKATLIALADRSIVASGKSDKGTYTIKYETPLRGIRGFRLEALPMSDLPGGGPGLSSNGNFVVTEIEVEAAPVGKPKQKIKVEIASGKADFSQTGFAPEQVFDGQSKDQRGWAVSPRGGTVHWATFQTKQPIDFPDGVELTFQIHQLHNAAAHRLAHFRLSVTTDDGDVPLGLPEAFAASSVSAKQTRDKDSLALLISYLQQSDPEWTKLQAAVAQAKKPLPEDEQLVALRQREKLLAVETPDDAKLVRLRNDFAASQEQVANRRLTLAQDLTWALINSPAFLFNH